MATIDDLFNNPEAAKFFKQGAGQAVKRGTAIVPRAVVPALPALWAMTIGSNIRGIADEYKYNKSLKDYQNVAYQNYLNSLGYEPSFAERTKELMREQGDFNKLYYKNNPVAGTLAQRIMRDVAAGRTKQTPNKSVPIIGETNTTTQAIKQVPAATKQEQEAMDLADALLNSKSNNSQIPNASTQRIEPTVDNGGITPITPQAPVSKTVEGIPTGYAANFTLEDLINMAQAARQQQANINADYIAELEGALKNTQQNYDRAYYRDLANSAKNVLTRSNAYSNLIGRYTPQQAINDRIKLQQLLAQAKQDQMFDPTPILSNAVLMQQLGIPETAALADKAAMNMYGNVYRTQQNTENLANRLAVQQAIENAKLQAKQDMFKQQLDERIREFNNPKFNNLAAQASVVGSLMNQAQIDPRVRQMITPEFIDYAMKLTGYQPTQQAQQTSGTVDIGR